MNQRKPKIIRTITSTARDLYDKLEEAAKSLESKMVLIGANPRSIEVSADYSFVHGSIIHVVLHNEKHDLNTADYAVAFKNVTCSKQGSDFFLTDGDFGYKIVISR